MNTTLGRALLVLVLSLTSLVGPRPAEADMIAIYPDLALAGEPAVVSGVPTEVTFVVTNTGRDPEIVAQPHLVLLDDGIRVPLTLGRYEVDGVTHGRFEELTLAPGASMRVRAVFTGITDRGERSWELALSFAGMRSPASVTIRRA